MTEPQYVHGYSNRESCRLTDQANTLTALLHSDTIYPSGSTVLEAGCGVGAQTVILARNSPSALFTSVDISRSSIQAARASIEKEGISNVTFRIADIFELPFKAESFDHVFVCFVLEHLQNPVDALIRLKSVLKKGGSMTIVEGDHGSTYFYPESRAASRAVQCLIDVQASLGGNSLIGRQVFPLLKAAGFADPIVSPRMVYVDANKPSLVAGFTKNTFIAMVEGVREQALQMNLTDEIRWDQGISDLYRTTHDDGVFCYTFFKGCATRPA